MEHENEVYKGFLLLPPTGKLLMKKSWQQKYCVLYKSSKFGIERLEIFDSTDTKPPPLRIITLENCIKITPETETRFTITTKSTSSPHEFCALNLEEKNKWLSAFQSVAFPDDASVTTTVEEDNDLYCSSGEGIFNVRIHPSPASERCGLDSTRQYTLLLTSTAIQLKNAYDSTTLYTWPYCFIRRYGYKSGKFTFEAGRKCESGEGTFFLEHSNQQEIFRCLASKMKSMKKLLKEDVVSSSSLALLDCGDNQFQAALSMEARSRSPLPPSPTASTTLHDIDSSTSSGSSILDEKKMRQKTDEKKIRPKPQKPPRKSLLKPTIPQDITYEPVDKYDQIEYRNDAWRTLGVDEVKHTENFDPKPDEDEIYTSWGDQKTSSSNVIHFQSKAPKIIKQPSADDNYDKLEFFGSSTKLNVKSGYKQVSVASGLNICPPSFNDYDEVQPAMEEIRLADDKHLGYALVRKTSNNNNVNKSDIDHQFHNDEPYAVISKPKRV